MKLKKTSHAYFGALILMPVYLFIVVAHLFFVPKFQGANNPANSRVVKKNTEAIYYLVRTDRSTFNENKTVKTTAKNKPAFFVSLVTNTNHLQVSSIGNKHTSQFFPDQHLSFLSNCILRI